MKKVHILFSIILICIAFVGCSNQNATSESNTISVSSITSTEAKNFTTEKLATSTSTTVATTASTTKKSSTSTSTTVKTTNATTVSNKSDANNSTTKDKTTTKKSNYCYLTIDCKEILDNIDDLKSGHSSYVAPNGYILKDYAYQITGNDTVYDVLKKACSDNSIKLTAKSSSYGIYVSGINNLDEMDCGKTSGWMYTLNGEYPSYSCDKITVSPNDKIVFKYVCKYN
jgi:hypothetical protein